MDRDPTTVPLAELDRLWDFDDPEGSEHRFARACPASPGRARRCLSRGVPDAARARPGAPAAVRRGRRDARRRRGGAAPGRCPQPCPHPPRARPGGEHRREGRARTNVLPRRLGGRPRGRRGYARRRRSAHARHRRAARPRVGVERARDGPRPRLIRSVGTALDRVDCEQHGLGASRGGRVRRGARALQLALAERKRGTTPPGHASRAGASRAASARSDAPRRPSPSSERSQPSSRPSARPTST